MSGPRCPLSFPSSVPDRARYLQALALGLLLALPAFGEDAVERFIWVGIHPNFEERRLEDGIDPPLQFTPSEIEDLVATHDLVILARFHGGFDRQLHHEAAAMIKDEARVQGRDVQVLAYFPAEQRLYDARYGTATFDDRWFVTYTLEPGASCDPWELFVPPDRCRMQNGGGGGAYIDLTAADYRRWALGILEGWMDADAGGPYDGVMFDLAYGSFGFSPRLRAKIGETRADLLVAALPDWISEVQGALPGKRVYYNGLQKNSTVDLTPGERFIAPFDVLPTPDGVHNEYFCYHKQKNLFEDEAEILTDVDLQMSLAAAGHQVLSRVAYNRPNFFIEPCTLPDCQVDQQALDDLSRFCYGAYLLGAVPGLTSFDFGWRTLHQSIYEAAIEEAWRLGPALGPYASNGSGLWLREFEHAWVAVNLGGSASGEFAIPERLTLVNGTTQIGEGTVFVVDDTRPFPVEANDSAFFIKPAFNSGSGLEACPAGLSHSKYVGGDGGFVWSQRERQLRVPACCDLGTQCSRGDGCYPQASIAPLVPPHDAVCADTTGHGPAFYKCGPDTVGLILPAAPGAELCCTEATSGGATRYLFEHRAHETCAARPYERCTDGNRNHNRRMGGDFGSDWTSSEVQGRFAACCNPSQACNRDACYSPGTILPRSRPTDDVCADTGAGPAIYRCDASRVGQEILSSDGTAYCCTRTREDGLTVYRFDDPASCGP